MTHYFIGMHGGFDHDKFTRDYRHGFGVEASMFASEKHLRTLGEYANEYGFTFGAHYPLIDGHEQYRDLFITSQDPAEQEAALERAARACDLIARTGGRYLLLHTPKPSIIAPLFCKEIWRFDGPREYIYAHQYPRESFLHQMHTSIRRLSAIALDSGVNIYLEQDIIPPYCSHLDWLSAFDDAKSVYLCLDIPRLHLQQAADDSFDPFAFAATAAKYVRHIHLSNAIANSSYYHAPVMQEQDPRQGWADIPSYAAALLQNGVRDYSLLFEHRSEKLSHDELDRCYEHVFSLFGPPM